jgi:hypothetical protein
MAEHAGQHGLEGSVLGTFSTNFQIFFMLYVFLHAHVLTMGLQKSYL